MAIDMKEYSNKLEQVQKGIISNDEWILYCQDLLCQIMDDTRDVFVRLKERGD